MSNTFSLIFLTTLSLLASATNDLGYSVLLSLPDPPDPSPQQKSSSNNLGQITIAETIKIQFDLVVKSFPNNKWSNIIDIGDGTNNFPRLPSVYLYNPTNGLHICLSSDANNNNCFDAKVVNQINKKYQIEIYYSTKIFMIAIDGNVEYFTTSITLQQGFINKKADVFVDDKLYPGADVNIIALLIEGCNSCDTVRNDMLNDQQSLVNKLSTCSTQKTSLLTQVNSCTDAKKQLNTQLTAAETVIGKTQNEINKYKISTNSGSSAKVVMFKGNDITSDVILGDNGKNKKAPNKNVNILSNWLLLYGMIGFIVVLNVITIIVSIACANRNKKDLTYKKIPQAYSSDDEEEDNETNA